MTTTTSSAVALHAVDLSRAAAGQFRATNARGGTIGIGTGDDTDFTPVELLLAALAGCASIDVDMLTSRRAEPTSFEVQVIAEKVRDENGNRLRDPRLSFRVEFPDDSAGDTARDRLPEAVQRAHDRLCTVSRTIELPSVVQMSVAG